MKNSGEFDPEMYAEADRILADYSRWCGELRGAAQGACGRSFTSRESQDMADRNLKRHAKRCGVCRAALRDARKREREAIVKFCVDRADLTGV